MTDYKYLYKVVTTGNSGVGKTSLLERYVYDKFNERNPSTIGVEFFVKTVKLTTGDFAKIQHWDIAGNPAFNNIVKTYFRNVDGGILVFDLTDRKSFNDLHNWIEKIQDSSNNKDVQFVLVGNKCDLVDNIVISDNEINQFIDEYSTNICKFFKTSAKNMNVDHVFKDLANAIYFYYEANGMKDKGLRRLQNITLGEQSSRSFCC